ncbi:MAG: phage late control D family protein [Myxococcales bacterium]|nr:phage late control D family protein [Myxococcales bacterium]
MTERLFTYTVPVIKIDGEANGQLVRDVLDLRVEEDIEGLKTAVMRFLAVGPSGGENEQLLYFDGTVFDFGKRVEVIVGPEDSQKTIFDGKITAIEFDGAEGAPPVIVVFAEDRLMDFRMTRRNKTYRDQTDADIANAIAGEYGMSAEADAQGPTYPFVQQWNMSDLAFLRDRARRVAAEVWVSGDTLYFRQRGNRNGTTLTLVSGNDIVSIKLRADLAHQRTKVKISGWDIEQRQTIEEEADVGAIRQEVASGKVGPQVLQDAFGERESFRVRDVPHTTDEAREWVKAEMLRRARAFVTAEGVTSGSPDMEVGSLITITNVAPPFEGDPYYVTHVCHTYDLQDGHRTSFRAERATITEG